jgi:AhpD family alkylhydroperoxidase
MQLNIWRLAMADVRKQLNDFIGGLETVGQTNGEAVGAFMGLLGAAYEPKTIDLKTKELMSIALGVYIKCEYCIVYNTYKAFEAGASKEEIMEAAMVSVAFGGGPAMAHTVTLLKECIDEFASDFE